MPRGGSPGTLTLRSVLGGRPVTRTRSAMSRATSAATARSPPAASETAIEGTPRSVPSIAADTERPVERQRVAAGALLALGRQDVRVPELGQRLLERGEAGGVDAIIVGKQQRGHRREKWSGRLDLNQRPHDPQSCALPGCATPRPQA